MLQERVAAANLRGPDKLPTPVEDLAADGGCKAGRRLGGWADGRMGRREYRVHGEIPLCSRESTVDLTIRVPE